MRVSEFHNQLAARATVTFHPAMRGPDSLKLKYLRGLGFIGASSNTIDDRLEWNLRQWEDAGVLGMDAGNDLYTLMQEIRLPASYGLSEAFGKVSWSVRGIYDGYAGWFDGNPTSMYEVPASSVYPDLVVLAYDARNPAALKTRIEDGWLQYGIRKAQEKLAAN